MKELTERQDNVLTFISEFIAKKSYPPTIREIANHFKISVKAAYDYVIVLKKKECIEMENKSPRTLKVIKHDGHDEEGAFCQIPVLGSVAAGERILSEALYSHSIHIHKSWIKPPYKNYFALTVRGDSMTGAGIMDGDTAVILKQETARDGDIIVAEIDEGFTIKRFFRENSRIRLQPENPAYKPVYCGNIRVVGVLACVYRAY
ncbi:MAG: transcriptional repressor LexA [Spirochaetaceae bacterium]|jgi:repressor LexA|nr:transcriptional repressor LexA [Spirochaetaceae bacterium]